MEVISQEMFKKEFDDQYFSTIMWQDKSKETANLVQGSMMVEQYATKFMELGRFAPYLVFIDSIRTQQFQDGLQMFIRTQVVWLEIKEFVGRYEGPKVEDIHQRGKQLRFSLEVHGKDRSMPTNYSQSLYERQNTDVWFLSQVSRGRVSIDLTLML